MQNSRFFVEVDQLTRHQLKWKTRFPSRIVKLTVSIQKFIFSFSFFLLIWESRYENIEKCYTCRQERGYEEGFFVLIESHVEAEHNLHGEGC